MTRTDCSTYGRVIAMSDDLQRVCATCHYCRMDTEAESIAMYGRVLGYGTCYGRPEPGWTVKAPAAPTCLP